MPVPFDPDAAAAPGSGLFGLDPAPEEAAVHVLAVPFDATTSYRGGAAHGPAAVLAASHQVDLYDRLFRRPWEAGIHWAGDCAGIADLNRKARELAAPIIAAGGVAADSEEVRRVDEIGARVNELLRNQTDAVLAAGKLPCVLGGDHSAPFGAIQACAERHPGLGLLHVDAHADLREAYEGFRWSHASILHNVLEEVGGVSRVVQFGIRDLGEREAARIEEDKRLHTTFDDEWERARYDGAADDLLRNRMRKLPEEVYLTIDVDGLDPGLCPNTGTPVPGGLTWADINLLLVTLANGKRRVVGMDLCEVSPGEAGDPDGRSWDAIVGARLLYRMLGAALATRC